MVSDVCDSEVAVFGIYVTSLWVNQNFIHFFSLFFSLSSNFVNKERSVIFLLDKFIIDQSIWDYGIIV